MTIEPRAADREDAAREHGRALMQSRALRLARVPAAAGADGDTLELVTFALGRERYAIESSQVRAILRAVSVTPVPGMPEHVAGVTNLRGEILLVVDLRHLFGIFDGALSDLTRLVVLGADAPEVGVLAESVQEVARVRIDRIQPPPPSAQAREHVRGVTDDAVIVLDAAVLLSDERLTIDSAEGHSL